MVSISTGIARDDKHKIEEILRSTGFFYDFEVATALEIVDETLADGEEKSGYYWMKLSYEGSITAFANYGRNDFSVHSWELYWIAVHQNTRQKNLGSILLKAVEDDARSKGCKIMWIETSGRPLYKPTEGFYLKNGYELAASLKDFYGPGDPKQIYSKIL
jgi:GNAT superfamily N-acetyltransferase